MRLPVCVLIITGVVTCLYLLGLLISHRSHNLINRSSEPIISEDEENFTKDLLNLGLNVDEDPVLQRLRVKIPCTDKILHRRTYQRGSYWVLENYVLAQRRHIKCYESITYTTHTDHTFLDNLVMVVNRWRAPISVAMFAPGSDFRNVVDSIHWMRNCLSNEKDMELIKEWVSFHLYFDQNHMPTEEVKWQEITPTIEMCSENPMTRDTFKRKNNLTYPVNVGRNVAREAAATYFNFPSDIELYPSPGIVPKFLKMISMEKGEYLKRRRVFPLAIYEVTADSLPPNSKTELREMLQQKKAQRFHASICSTCHSVPENNRWESSPESQEMRIFVEIKRQGSYHHWEPIYIGTQEDPLYDERLSWEGKSDKMTQGYLLCVLDYTMSLLSDAFLTHRPGYKKNSEATRPVLEAQTLNFIQKVIKPELEVLYGKREGCIL